MGFGLKGSGQILVKFWIGCSLFIIEEVAEAVRERREGVEFYFPVPVF